MLIRDRERQIIALLARYSQATAAHINALVFTSNASPTPCYRALQRLMAQNLVTRISHRMLGGVHGGSGQYVYCLSGSGIRLAGLDKRFRSHAVNYHALAVLDAVVTITKVLPDATILNEPECWETVGGVELRPDLYVTMDHQRWWLEVDLATEQPRQVLGKIDTFCLALANFTTDDLKRFPRFPIVTWVVPNQPRKRELLRLVRESSEPEIFRVVLFDELSGYLYTGIGI